MTGSLGTPRERRPAASYVAHEGDVLVPAWFVGWLDRQVNLQRVRDRAKAEGVQHVEVVTALLYASALASPDPSASTPGRKLLGTAPEVAPPSTDMSASQAADVLGITARAVRLACSDGRLVAQHLDGVWHIAPADLADYRAQRGQ